MAELADGRSLDSVARRHGVTCARLRWWRWRLGTGPTAALVPTRMVEIMPVSSPMPIEGVRLLIGDVVLELPGSMPPGDVGRLVAAVRSSC